MTGSCQTMTAATDPLRAYMYHPLLVCADVPVSTCSIDCECNRQDLQAARVGAGAGSVTSASGLGCRQIGLGGDDCDARLSNYADPLAKLLESKHLDSPARTCPLRDLFLQSKHRRCVSGLLYSLDEQFHRASAPEPRRSGCRRGSQQQSVGQMCSRSQETSCPAQVRLSATCAEVWRC